MQPASFMTGKRTVLGPVDASDAPAYAAWVNDPRVRPFLNRPWPASVDDERRRVESLIGAPDAVGFSIRIRDDQRLIGRSAIRGIHHVNRCGTFTIFIGDPDCWGRGFGTEATALTTVYAMDLLNLNRLELEVFAYNPRALRCYEKLGFQKEGVRRDAKFHEGGYHDAVVMSILAREWKGPLRDRLRAFLDAPAVDISVDAATP
jgi:RimJ/RimL family protein N-acetyltransferase